MAATKGFLLGLITGGATVWWLKDRIARSVDARTRAVRARAAHGLESVANAIDAGLTGTPATDMPVADQTQRIGRAS